MEHLDRLFGLLRLLGLLLACQYQEMDVVIDDAGQTAS
jgi:hypothetical protein